MQHGPKVVLLFLAFLFLLTACSSEESKSADKSVSYEKAELSNQNNTQVEANADKSTNYDIQPNNRMVIYNANLQLEVKELKDVQLSISEMVDEMGGYIVDQTTSHFQDEHYSGSLTVRIPQKNFQSFIHKVEQLGVRVKERNITGQDVTEEYVDLESRLKSKQVVENRLLEFMKQAKDTKDLLDISTELAKVQEEIETLKGRMKYLENQASLSTITIHLTENKVIVPDFEKDHLNTWDKTKKQFMKSINLIFAFFSSLIVFIIGNIPVLIIIALIGLIAYIVAKKMKRKTNRKE